MNSLHLVNNNFKANNNSKNKYRKQLIKMQKNKKKLIYFPNQNSIMKLLKNYQELSNNLEINKHFLNNNLMKINKQKTISIFLKTKISIKNYPLLVKLESILINLQEIKIQFLLSFVQKSSN